MALGRVSAVALLALAGLNTGCFLVFPPGGGPEADGALAFGYVFLTQDPNDPLFATNGGDAQDPATFRARDCAGVGAATVVLRLLDERGQTVAEGLSACSSVIGGDGNLSPDEFGVFVEDFPPGAYAGFAVEVQDAGGLPIAIRPLLEDAAALSDPEAFGDFLFFDGGVGVEGGLTGDLDFAGAGQFGVDLNADGAADAGELQLCVPFDGQ
jgi:hypothetical protein